MADHPSFFQLDSFAAGAGGAAVAEHVRVCADCRAYLAQLAVEGPVPAWARVTQAPRRPRAWRYAWPTLVAASVAALLVVGAMTENEPETRAKSMPSFALYIEHDGGVRLWDGRGAVVTGDRLQLKVAPAGYRYLVVAEYRDAAWGLLHAGAVAPSGETVLPQSWQVDDSTPSVALGLLLCDHPCSRADLEASAAVRQRDASRWFSSVTVPGAKP